MDQTRYDQMKSLLLIDRMRLTEELENLPSVMQEAAESVAECQRDRDAAKDALSIAIAEADFRVREYHTGEKVNETQIKAEAAVDEAVIEATEVLRTAEYNLKLWQGLADGMRSKSYAIGTIADLIKAGYITPDTIYVERRTAVNRERRRLSGDG